mgnify:CR=1 FL=1
MNKTQKSDICTSKPNVEEMFAYAGQDPDLISFHSNDQNWVMRITPDRRIEVNEDVELSEVARTVFAGIQDLLDTSQYFAQPCQECERLKHDLDSYMEVANAYANEQPLSDDEIDRIWYRIQNNPNRILCNYCNKEFYNNANINKHLRNNSCKVKKELDKEKEREEIKLYKD